MSDSATTLETVRSPETVPASTAMTTKSELGPQPKAQPLAEKAKDQTLAIPPSLAEEYRQGSTLELTDAEMAALAEPFPDEAHDIKSTEAGEVFVGQTHIRHRLNRILRGAWTLEPVPFPDGKMFATEGKGDEAKTVVMRGRLYVRGRLRSEHIGEQRLSWERMTYTTACEAAHTDALTRCAKDLSVGWECWDRQWCDAWRQKFAIRVTVKKKGEVNYLWRRKDSGPLRGEVTTEGPRTCDPGETDTAAPRTTETLISQSQSSDLWALITERFPRKRAEGMAREILQRHGFDSFKHVTAAKYPAIVAEIKATVKEA